MSNNNEDNNDKKDIFQLFNSSLKSTERMKELNSPLKSKMKGSYSVNDIKLLSNVIPAADAKNKFIKKVVEGLQLGIGNFILGYNIRAGIGIMLRLFELIRKKRYRSMLNLKIVLDEHNLSFRLDAVSLGLFVGYFTGGYKSIVAVLEYLRGKESKWHSVVAGNVAAVSLIFLDKPRRRTLAMYLCVRAIQCLYNEAKSRKWWHFWGSNWQHGDVLLFALSSAQIMYAYVMRPKTLPMSYFKFIQTTGPVHMKALRFVKNSIRGTSEVSMVRVNAFLASRKSTFNFTGVSDTGLLPCQVIHSDFVNCNRAIFDAFVNGCRKSFPLYVSLHFVPTMVLRLRQSFLHPIRTFIKCLQAAMRSTVFLGAFVSTYQMIICRHRILYPYNSKFLYYFAANTKFWNLSYCIGLFASLSIFIEQKSRRSGLVHILYIFFMNIELALYVLPRAFDSIFMILQDRKLFSGVPGGEIALFSLAMGIIMYFYEHQSSNLSPTLLKLLRRFLEPWYIIAK